MVDPLETPASRLLTAANPNEAIPARVRALGDAIDGAADRCDKDILKRADAVAESLIALDPESATAAEVAYLRANAWAGPLLPRA